MTTPRIGWLVTVFALALTATRAAAQEPQVGVVSALEGSAQALHRGQTDWGALAGGDGVLLGDRLRTQPVSRLKLLLKDESVLTLGPSSELSVDEQVVASTGGTSALSVVTGAVRAVVPPKYGTPGSRFDVSTPTAVAGVRGTTFVVAYDQAAELTRVLCLSGTVVVRGAVGARREVTLRAGEITEIGKDGIPTKPRTPTSDEVDAMDVATQMLAGGKLPERELAPGTRRTADPDAPGSNAAGDPATARQPGEDVQPPEQQIIDQPIDRLRQRRPQTPPVPPGRQ